MKVFQWLLNLFFPPTCVECFKEGDFFCGTCQKKLKIKPIGPFKKAKNKEFQYLDGVIYALDYQNNKVIKSAVKQFKYKFSKPLAEKFAGLMHQKLEELNMLRSKKITLIPIPLHPRRKAYRGFNQAELMAKEIKKIGREVSVCRLLKRIKNTKQQAKLSRFQRLENLESAFVLVESIALPESNYVFLIDDICTTGATLDSAAKILKEAGVKKVYGLVLARAFK